MTEHEQGTKRRFVGVALPVTSRIRKVVEGTRFEHAAFSLYELPKSARVQRNAREDEQLRRLILLTLATDSVCVDVGANTGAILSAMIKAAPNGRHYAFEPVPMLALSLAAKYPTAEVRCEAASDVAGTANFSHVPERESRSGLSETLDLEVPEVVNEIAVPTVRLDDVIERTPALLKIDVEGAELKVLRGARRLMEQCPIIAIEHQFGGAFVAARSVAVWDELTSANYRLFDLDGLELSQEEFLEVVRRRLRWNFIAHK